jgi:uncharacterized membrane protein YfcA
MTALTVALAAVVGISLGMLGGGGSILTVPLLTYVGGFDPKQAIAMSLLVVGVTSTVGAIPHARAGRVRWRVAAIFGAAAMTGAYTGGRLAHFVSGTVLLIAFAVVMIVAGVAMLHIRGETQTSDRQLPLLRVISSGAAVGVVSGLVGAGGGFLLVPALSLLANLPMPAAVGTSLVIIAAQSYAGLVGHIAEDSIDWTFAAAITAAAVAGALIGSRLIRLVDPAGLRRAFGWLVLLMASVVLAEEVHPAVGATAATLTVSAAAVNYLCARCAHCPLRRSARVAGSHQAAA